LWILQAATSEGYVVDPGLDYGPSPGTISTTTADGLLTFIKQNGINIRRILQDILPVNVLPTSLVMYRQ
jgi:hypothetical protein